MMFFENPLKAHKIDSGNKVVMAMLAFALLLVLQLMPSASAVQVSNSNNGYVIEYPPITTVPFNQTISFSFHVFNATSGGYINASALSCDFHLYNNTGNHLLRAPLIWTGDHDYFVLVNGSTFTYVGNYGYAVQCGDEDVGGFNSVPIVVTPKGYEPVGDVTFSVYTVLFLGILFGIIFLFLFTFGGLLSLQTDVLDVSLNIGAYFTLFGFKFLVGSFIGIPLMDDVLDLVFKIAIWTNVFLPIVAFFLTITLGTLLRKKYPEVFARMPGYKAVFIPGSNLEEPKN